MLVFENNNKCYVFIHIPKNSGKYIRHKIANNPDNKILNDYWHIESNLDLAHIPYMKKNDFITHTIEKYFTYTRCPYDRIISGFFYKNSDKNIDDFKIFIKNTLISYDFDISFDYMIIHYYPQYLFICDENLDISHVEINKIEDNENPRKYDLLQYFDDESIHIINRIYEKDFLFFNYSMI